MKHLLLALACVIALASPAAAENKPLSPPAQFVQKLGDQALVELTDKTLGRAAREARAHTLLTRHFDIQTIGRFALGPAWREASEAEKKEYMRLFEDMIVKTYTSRFEEYSGQSFQVDGMREDGDRDHIVNSRILQKGGPPVLVDWRVRKKDGSFKIVDVIVESISMSVTQRSDFSAVIQRGGGKVEALLVSLRTRKNGGK